LSASAAHLVPADRFIDCLLQATRAMVENNGRATNAEVFAEAFYPRIGQSRESLEPVLECYYELEYPKLETFARRKPEARQVVGSAFDLGYAVVIATNPLFPASAVFHRMRWAGVDGFPYSLITSYENSRACKPNLLYYRNICEQIGLAAGACLVVGNEGLDMVAARMGCPTFLVTDHATALGPEVPEPTYRGTLLELETLLRR
jgi:FMN phosphatase YigB (HAD superfamily)